jgi:adenosylhomocysteinase
VAEPTSSTSTPSAPARSTDEQHRRCRARDLRSAPARDHKVADSSLADFGRKEIDIAETEMPGLMALRKPSTARQAAEARRAHHRQPAHDHPDRGADRDPGGARRRGALGSCNIFSTQDHAAAAIAARGMPVYAWKGETLEEYWWCTEQVLNWPDGGGPNMILDDGGDATLLVHKGVEYEKAGACPRPPPTTTRNGPIVLGVLGRTSTGGATRHWHRIAEGIKGVTEETTTGVHRLYQMHKAGELLFPAINVNDSVTKSKFDNLYGCRESLVDGIKRATDVMIAGKVAWSAATATSARAAPPRCGPRRAQRDGSPRSTRSARCRRRWRATEVVTMDDVATRPTSSSPPPATSDIITPSTCSKMKDQAIVCNIGHFDNEIEVAG